MTFGRQSNLVRRAIRPDQEHHRLKRRRRLDHPFAVGSGRRGILSRLLRLLGLRR